jgi:sporulation protein YlmC with PRC-barrel domain
MTHFGRLASQHTSDEVHDVRGATIRGPDGAKIGKLDDVIVDHDTMEIAYLVVDSDGWLETGHFLLPADRVFADENHEEGLATEVTLEQIKNSPQYDGKSGTSGDTWEKYEQEFKQYWEEGPVMHMKNSDRIITPLEGPVPAKVDSTVRDNQDSPMDVAKLFPERMTDVFTDTAPRAGKVTLRPKSAVRAEEAASGVTLMKPNWWEAFENYVRVNKSDIQSKCPECTSKAA